MKEQIQRLRELQAVDSEIVRMSALMREIPKRISAAEHGLREAEAARDRQKQKAEAAEKKRRDRERALEDVNERIRKMKARTGEIKSNKEYQAHLKEIEAAEHDMVTVEDEILVLMEAVEAATAELRAAEAKVKAEQGEVEAFRQKLNGEVSTAEKELNALKQRRATIIRGVDKEVYGQYFEILKLRGGLAIVPARGEICQGCNMNIPPQLFVELKRGERLILCPQCGRILCWEGDGA